MNKYNKYITTGFALVVISVIIFLINKDSFDGMFFVLASLWIFFIGAGLFAEGLIRRNKDTLPENKNKTSTSLIVMLFIGIAIVLGSVFVVSF